ncbi:MAG: hypothetical protein VYA87_09080, partial [SAR324 cluster bacterium]|nr:hypothetical protein [SAR324 cluster bacterium]
MNSGAEDNINVSSGNLFFPQKKLVFNRKYGVFMEKAEKKEQIEMMREAGVQAGIVPVQNLFNEDQRIE